MSSELNQQEHDLLQMVVVGELERTHPDVVAASSTSLAFRKALQEHFRLRCGLSANRELLQQANSEITDSDRALVRASMEEALPPSQPGTSAFPRMRNWLWIAAAVFLLAIPAVRQMLHSDSLDPDGVLGLTDTRIIRPRGEVEAFLPIRIDYAELGPHRRVQIRLLTAEGIVLAEVERFADEKWLDWNPELTDLNQNEQLRIEVEVYGLDNLLTEVLVGDASRISTGD